MTLVKEFNEWVGVEKVPATPRGTYVGFRIGFFDLETWGLNASVHRIFCGAVADNFGNVTLLSSTQRKYYTNGDPMDDSLLAVAIRDELEKYDILVGWNSSGFDLPFLNGRLLPHKARPVRSDIMHLDLMWRYGGRSRWSARMGSRKLQYVSEAFKTPNAKVPLTWEVWERAKGGDREAKKLIEQHNVADVLVTRDVFAYTKPLIQNVHR